MTSVNTIRLGPAAAVQLRRLWGPQRFVELVNNPPLAMETCLRESTTSLCSLTLTRELRDSSDVHSSTPQRRESHQATVRPNDNTRMQASAAVLRVLRPNNYGSDIKDVLPADNGEPRGPQTALTLCKSSKSGLEIHENRCKKGFNCCKPFRSDAQRSLRLPYTLCANEVVEPGGAERHRANKQCNALARA